MAMIIIYAVECSGDYLMVSFFQFIRFITKDKEVIVSDIPFDVLYWLGCRARKNNWGLGRAQIARNN